ncbi:MAG: porin family protein [Elusimicrobiaceae bacterium]|nr:porin family protein [Elusimicrobiaceae bacterium]MBR3899720.1 porin family protein [Elusimicrobiaceae bacterium]
MKRGITAVTALLMLASVSFAQTAPNPAQGRVIKTDTTTVYDVTTTNKRGTTEYGVVEQTESTPRGGTRLVNQMEYSDYTPSMMSLANAKKGELSLAFGMSQSYSKDTHGTHFADLGMGGNAQLLFRAGEKLSLGLDYMLLMPHDNKGKGYSYEKLRLNGVAFAGKYTFNPYDRLNFYLPMGIGMAQVRLKGHGEREGVYTSESRDKWGLDMFAGLGMQYNLSESVFLGMEYRYVVAFVTSDDLNRYYGKGHYFQFHNAFLRLGMRF